MKINNMETYTSKANIPLLLYNVIRKLTLNKKGWLLVGASPKAYKKSCPVWSRIVL